MRKNVFRLIFIVVFGVHIIGTDAARAFSAQPNDIMLPAGTLMTPSRAFSLPTFKAIAIDPKDPFKINFVVDVPGRNQTEKLDQEQVNLLIKYFLGFLTLPEEDLWVNLSPYEKGHIIPSDFEGTNAGRDMLVQDYILKQLASSLTYPNHELGRIFWKRIFDRARAEYGSTKVPIKSFNKVWVVPDKAVVYEGNGSAFIAESRLKVMVEEDYLSMQKNSSRFKKLSEKNSQVDYLSTQLMRELIIPELEREVNKGKYFASLRQMFNSLVLAIWFKKRLKEDLIKDVYADKKKTSGILLHEKLIKEKIYAQYLRALKKGAYNFIREDYDENLHQVVPRKYFSGGFSFTHASEHVTFRPAALIGELPEAQRMFGKDYAQITVLLNPIGVSRKTLMSLWAGMLLAGGVRLANADTIPSHVFHAQEHHSSVEQVEKDITGLKEDMAYKRQLVRDPWMKGGQRLMIMGSLGFEEKRLGQLEQEWQGFVPATPVAQVTPPVVQPAAPVAQATPPVVQSAAPVVQVTPPVVQPAAPVAQATTFTAVATSPSTFGKFTPVVRPPLPAFAVVATSHPVAFARSSSQADVGGFHFLRKVSVTALEDNILAGSDGVITGLNPDKKHYLAGEEICSIMNLELEKRIEKLTSQKEIITKRLTELKGLYAQQAATLQELVKVQQEKEEINQQLDKASQEKEAAVVIAADDMTVDGDWLVALGQQVAKNDRLARYYDNQRLQVSFKLPLDVNYFNRIKNFKINGVPAKSIMNIDWSLDPLQQKAQLKFVGVFPSAPTADAQGAFSLDADFLFPQTQGQTLVPITGKISTIAQVRQVEEYVVRAPMQGQVRFLVYEGENVREGQIVAVVDHKHLDDEYQSISLALAAKNMEIGTAEASRMIPRAELDNLKTQKAELLARGKLLYEQIERMNIRAPHSGFVHGLTYGSKVFQAEDRLLTIGTGKVLIGGINDVKGPVLFPQGMPFHDGDPIAIETVQGIFLPGRVVAVNQTPFASSIDLSKYQSLEVMAVDQQNILYPDLPVKVIVPMENEKKSILDAFGAFTASSMTPMPAGVGGNQPPPFEQQDLFSLISPYAFTGTARSNTSLTMPGAPSFAVNLSGVRQAVASNELAIGPQNIEIIQKKLAEALPKATRFSLNGGVYFKDGKLTFDGGARGMFNNMIGGGLQSGNALGASSPIVSQILGNITDLLTGKVAKETRMAQKATDLAVHHMQTVVFQQVKEAQDLLIDIGSAEQKIEQLKALESESQKAKEAMLKRQAGVFSLPVENSEYDLAIQNIHAQRLALEDDLQNWTVALNSFMGPDANGHINFDRPIAASLPWGKEFSSIDVAAQNLMEKELTGKDSPNPRMQEALITGQSTDLAAQLQGLEKLPTLYAQDIEINGGSATSAIHNISDNEYLQRTSEVTRNNNLGAQFNIPIFNSRLKAETKIMALEKKRIDLNIKATKVRLSEELKEAVNNINFLSRQIKESEKAYQDAFSVWKMKEESGLYLPYQISQERIQISKQAALLIDLKAQYLKEEARLREMRVLGEDNSTDLDNRFALAVSSAIGGHLSTNWFTASPLLALPGPPEGISINGPNPLQGQVLVPGSVNYHVYSDVPSTWALMHPRPLAEMKKILISEPNIYMRAEDLDHFLTEYQSKGEFLPALKDVLNHSPYPEVIWKLLKYMSGRRDRDVGFFMQTIDGAEKNNNPLLAGLGFQALDHMITLHPEVLTNLTPTALSPQVSPEIANKVFLTLLSQQPKYSIATENILQSDFWDTDDLAKIYHQMGAYIDNQETRQDVSRAKRLRDLIHDTILRKVALADIDDVYILGGFDNLGIIDAFFTTDVITSVQIAANEQDAENYLKTSPDWRNIQNVLPMLYDSSLQETQKTLNNASGIEGGDPLYDLSAPRTSYEEDYLKILGLNGRPGESVRGDQEAYINKADISEVNQIFELPTSSTPLRNVALDRLMGSDLGRALVLRTYLESSEANLLGLIEQRPWKQIAMTDMPKMTNAAVKRIYRDALNKMATRTGQEEYSLVGLQAYSAGELHLLPEGSIKEARINVVALSRAWLVYDKKQSIWTPWSGYRKMETRVKDEWVKIEHRITLETDPRKVDAYFLECLNTAKDPQVKSMLEDLKSIRDDIAGKIRTNDQHIPMISKSELSVIFLCGAALTVSFLKRMYGRIFRHFAGSASLNRRIYRRFYGRPHTNGRNHARVIESMLDVPPPKNEYEFTMPALRIWYDLVADWDKESQVKAEVLIPEFNTVLNRFEEALMKMPYTPELMNSREGAEGGQEALKQENYSRTFDYVLVLALDTREIIKDRLKGQDLDDTQREQLLAQNEIFKRYIDYVVTYRSVLSHRGNIDEVIRYKFSNRHPTEWPWAKISRFILGETRLWNVSSRKIMKDISSTLDQGNELMGLYPDKARILFKSKELLESAGKRGGSLTNPLTQDVRHQSRLGTFFGKMKYVLGAAWLAVSIGAIILGYKFLGARFSLVGTALFFTITYFTSWGHVFTKLEIAWKKDTEASLGKQDIELEKTLNPPGKRKITVSEQGEKDIVAMSNREGDEQARIELASGKPTVGLIVIVSENPDDSSNLDEYESSRRGTLIRNDVPVIFVPSEHKGSGNAYLYALLKAKKKYEKMPHAKSWDDLNVMFVFHGKYASSQKGLEYFLLDLAIKDGYRFARKDPTSKAHPVDGHILVYTQDAYFGLMPYFPVKGIRMAGAKVNGEDLKEFSFVDTAGEMASSKTYSEAYHIYRNLDIADLERDKKSYKKGVWAILVERFLPKIRTFKQYPVLNGRIAIARDAVKVLTDIAEYMDKNELWETLPLSLEWDLLNPLIIQHQITDPVDFKEEINDYLDERTEWGNLRKRDGRQVEEQSLRALYEVLQAADSEIDGSPKVETDIFEPNSRMSQLMRIANGGSSSNAVARIKEVVNAAQVSSSSAQSGGIDLSTINGRVVFKDNKNSLFSASSLLAPKPDSLSLQSFQGFNFQVVKFQPIPNPSRLFLGSSGHSGDWFSPSILPNLYQKQRD